MRILVAKDVDVVRIIWIRYNGSSVMEYTHCAFQ